jgi:hypothetical protein
VATEPKSRRRRRKKIVRRDDGSLFDASERRRITAAELRDHVRDGGLFEARRERSGTDCTYEVLTSVMGTGMLQNLVPGLGSGPLGGLGGLGGGGGGLLGALGGAAGVADVVRALGEERDRHRDDDWDDRGDDDRRRRRRRAAPSEGRGWPSDEFTESPSRPPKHDRPDRDWASDADFE